MELHLSGFGSMIGSIIKPWTAAMRLGLSFLTPSAPGLVDRSLCRQEDLSCFFKPLGPQSCQPASHSLPQVRTGNIRYHSLLTIYYYSWPLSAQGAVGCCVAVR